MDGHCWYLMSNSLSLIDQLRSRPTRLGLCRIFMSGELVSTTIVYDWKYGLSFRTNTTKVSVNFSVEG